MEFLTTLGFWGCYALASANFAERRKLQDEIHQQTVVSVSTQVTAHPIVDIMEEFSGSIRLEDDGLFEDGLEIPDTRHAVLHFKHKPEVVLDQNGYSLPKWNVSWQSPPGMAYNMLGMVMRRQFVRLYHLAKRGLLCKADAKTWSNILHDIDYADYCEQIRPPLFAFGVLVRRIRGDVVVRMAGGEEELLDDTLARALDIVDVGKCFSVMFKRTKGKIVVFEDVCPLYDNDSAIREDLRGMLA